METNYEILDNELVKYKNVSFDLFDTLAFRTVSSPEDIFYLMEQMYYEQHHIKLKNYAKKRIDAERSARQGKPEITIDDIYKEIDIKNDVLKLSLEALEKEVEIQSIIPHKNMVEIVKKCKERNQRIIVITDMYLDRDTVKCILNKIGVPYDELFISAETKCTKLTGKMYEYVLNKLNINPKDIIHVGDDKLKDVIRAREHGIRALQSIICANANLNESIVENHIGNLNTRKLQIQAKNNNTAFDIGYKVIGPFLFEFCRWVHAIADKKNAKQIVFVAREGYLIKKIYETMYPEDRDVCLYLCLNKNLLRFPILHVEPTIENFLSTIPSGSSISLNEVLSYFFLDDLQKTAFLQEFKNEFSDKKTFEMQNLAYNNEFIKIFNQLIKLKAEDIKKQYDYFISYIKNKGLTQNVTLLVNNSFNGNGQKLLTKILNLSNMSSDNLFIGVQFAKSYKCFKYNQNSSLGWLNTVASDELAYEFSKYALLFEHLLFEPIGTAKEFTDKGIEFEERGLEERNDAILNIVQKYAIDFADDYIKHVPITIEKYAIKELIRLFQYPTFDEAILIGDLYDYDVIGTTLLLDISNIKLSNNYRAIFQIRRYSGIHWRQGIMSLLLFGDNVLKLYNFLTKFRIKQAVKPYRKITRLKSNKRW